MKKTLFRVAIILLLPALLWVSSCRKDTGSSGWNTQMLVPIVSSSLSLQNIVTDSSLTINKDSSLTLSFTSNLYQFNLASQIAQIPDTSIGQKFNLNTLELPNSSFNYDITLGNVAANSGALGIGIISQLGQSVPFPPISGLSTGNFAFNASGYFDSAYIIGGYLAIWVVNYFPVAIGAGSVITITNDVPGNHNVVLTYIVQTSIPPPPGIDSVYLLIPLDGDTITSNMVMSVSNLNTPGSNGANVLIDTADQIQLKMGIENMQVSQAWAKFPSEAVIDQERDVSVVFADRQLTYIDVKQGFLRVHMFNSVPQPLDLTYTLVGAYNNLGHPLVVTTHVPAETVNGPGRVDDTINLTGYSISLTGKNGSQFNTYSQRVQAVIDSSTTIQHLTLADSVNVTYDIIGIQPNYLKGYLGVDTASNIDSAAFSFLNIFKSGTIGLQNVNMNFTAVNSIGVGGQVKLNSLVASSSINNISKTLSGSVVGKGLNVTPASDFPLTPSVNSLSLNSGNSNIQDLLGILPNKLQYNVQIRTNVNGNSGQYREFAYLDNTMSLNLNAEIPLSLIANNLVLVDTIGFNLANTNTNVAGISDGNLNIIVENKYPINAVLTMVIYDSTYHAVDTLFTSASVAAGQLDANCRVDAPQQTVLTEYVDQNVMNRIKLGRSAIITAVFNTPHNGAGACNGQHLKIYNDYTLGVTISAKFNYRVTTKF